MNDNSTNDSLHEDAMMATADALGEHGFAELTMRAIAERTKASKSTLHYRYGSKEGVVTAFLEFLGETMETQFAEVADESPLDRLVWLLDDNLERLEDSEQGPLTAAYLEIHARAARNDAYREAIADSDHRYREEFVNIIEEGIETGVFCEVDVWATATLLVAIPDSAGLHAATLGNRTAIDELRTAVNDLILESLLADDVDVDHADLL